jgi:hypothetical protein
MPKENHGQIEKVLLSTVRFLGEQDGPFERILKNKLVDTLSRFPEVRRAYLARATYSEDPSSVVVLGITADIGNETEIANSIGSVFSSLFNAREHLDLIFLSAIQELEIKDACSPFFVNEHP